MKKLLFLDFDGVLNNNAARAKMPICGFHSKLHTEFNKSEFNFVDSCIDNLRAIVKHVPKLQIVISSNWRFGATPNDFNRLFNMFDIYPDKIDLIEQTGEDNIYKRSFIIAKYIRDFREINRDEKMRFVCVDDRPDLYHNEWIQHSIFTDPNVGLTYHQAADIIDRLTF